MELVPLTPQTVHPVDRNPMAKDDCYSIRLSLYSTLAYRSRYKP